jgi:very-short-patch-repair endonuclease
VVLVPRGRAISDADRRVADVRRAGLEPHDVVGIATTPLRTALDCARNLPYDAALAVVDSALRVSDLDRNDLLAAAEQSPRTGRAGDPGGPGSRPARGHGVRVRHRPISHDVPGLHLVPQVTVLPGITPDLVDEPRRIVVECDSWTCHSERTTFRRDQERFNALALAGWLVLRFGLEHTMSRPAYVTEILQQAVVASGTHG